MTRKVLSLAFVVALATGGFGPAADAPKSDRPKAKKVAILIFPDVELLDFAGPGEVFAASRDTDGNKLFEVFTVGLSKKPVKSQGFLTITPQYDPADAPSPDLLVIPGGNVLPVMADKRMMAWIAARAKANCLMFSVCNGASVLAKTGLLDGLEVTTHHGNREILTLLAPKTICLKDRRFIDNGQVVTSAGVSAGIDGALYLVGKLKGAEAARRTATHVEFDSWSGFEKETDRLTKSRSGAVSQKGRIHEGRRWAVMTLLATIRDKGIDDAKKLYPKLLEGAKGHDREMIEEAGFTETAVWLFEHSRDPEVGLNTLRFVASVHPKSSKAHTELGRALLATKNTNEAKRCLAKALELDPKNESARKLLDTVK